MTASCTEKLLLGAIEFQIKIYDLRSLCLNGEMYKAQKSLGEKGPVFLLNTTLPIFRYNSSYRLFPLFFER